MANSTKRWVSSVFITLATILVGLGFSEGVLRLKNASMKNYDIEMWRYANELKVLSPDPDLGHEHKINTEATLQSVKLRTNEWGLRGGPLSSKPTNRTILFLGSSITFGWGVTEEETMVARLESSLRGAGEDVSVLNAGIGNYNSYRYVERFFRRLEKIQPTDIVVNYFLRDAEVLDYGRGNWLLKNSELAVTLWSVIQRMQTASKGVTLEGHYQKVYDPNSEGYKAMKASLQKLSNYAKTRGIRVYLAMTPDVHNLKNYPFRYIHSEMAEISKQMGFRYIDLLPALENYSPEQIWSMPGDPHPNGFAHGKMAAALFPFLHEAGTTINSQKATP